MSRINQCGIEIAEFRRQVKFGNASRINQCGIEISFLQNCEILIMRLELTSVVLKSYNTSHVIVSFTSRINQCGIEIQNRQKILYQY